MAALSIAEARDWLVVIQAIATGLLFVVVLWLNARYVTRKDFEVQVSTLRVQLDQQRDQLNSGARRFDVIQTRLEHLPTSAEIRKLNEELARVDTSIHGLQDRIDGVGTTLRSHENRLAQLYENALRRGGDET